MIIEARKPGGSWQIRNRPNSKEAAELFIIRWSACEPETDFRWSEQK